MMSGMKEIQYPIGFDKEISEGEIKQICDQFFKAYLDAQEPIDTGVKTDASLASDDTDDDDYPYDDYPHDGDGNDATNDDDNDDDATNDDDDDDDATNGGDDDDGNDQQLPETVADRAFGAWQVIVKNDPGYFVW